MILIGFFHFVLFFFGFEEPKAKHRICENTKLEKLDWDDFKWLYKQQDSTVLQDSITSYVFIRVNTDGTQETKVSPELHTPWLTLLAAEIDSFQIKRDSLLTLIRTPYKLKYTSNLRDKEEQLALQKKGYSKAFVSFHNFGLAADGSIARKGKALRRGEIYDQYGAKAKKIGLFWGGDFVGFPDPGHIQAFYNSAKLLQKYPDLALEYEPFKQAYERNYFKKVDMGQQDQVKDTRDLLNEMNRLRENQPCACSQAIPFPASAATLQVSPNTMTVVANLKEQYIFIQRGSFGYFYPMGRWKLR
ncbi:M15 family metallopeptidase [Aquirufa sp. HETE-83D]|uniref:M15 family metallopeptidase n=1 Tax=Aquirufa esocilacus TaxID=3096513 RepID=A0ABW6DP71_9BACT